MSDKQMATTNAVSQLDETRSFAKRQEDCEHLVERLSYSEEFGLWVCADCGITAKDVRYDWTAVANAVSQRTEGVSS